jgi:hypothetical protein
MLGSVGLLPSVRGTLVATETGVDTAAGTGHLEAVPADVAEGSNSANLADSAPTAVVHASAPEPKMTGADWVRTYLTEDKKKELKSRYKRIGQACAAIHKDMKADSSKVDAYRTPRVLERFLVDLYPVKKGSG